MATDFPNFDEKDAEDETLVADILELVFGIRLFETINDIRERTGLRRICWRPLVL